ncbi:hypothetical protein SAMCCGM7_pA0292 (plasmid) [Sinorhizobium americanum CCGM7]|nr:hypothetical protein SAMCCGM7_pA0292 [Sinorhizobium americanum CCGM7]
MFQRLDIPGALHSRLIHVHRTRHVDGEQELDIDRFCCSCSLGS